MDQLIKDSRKPNYQSTSGREPTTINDTLSENIAPAPSVNVRSSHVEGGIIQNAGINVLTAAVFVAGEMAGSGVLALPKAVVDSGWIGLLIVIVCCINAGYGGSRLGECWAILEERYPEYRGNFRNPYATIADRAVGKWGSILVSLCMQITLFGASIVYLLLAAQLVQDLLKVVFPRIGFCMWFLIFALMLIPAMWLGSPKDFWLVGVGALLSTTIAVVFIATQMLIDGLNIEHFPPHRPHTFKEFFIAFGTILFSFGGVSTFPTIQNDMIHRHKFSKSVMIAFVAITGLYSPLVVGGYLIYGDSIEPNVVMSLSHTTLVSLANIAMAVHLILAFLIIINPVCQDLEEMLQVPPEFCLKRCVVRTCMILLMIVTGATVPRFSKILALVGGSTITLTTFVLPNYFYLRLSDQKAPNWPSREIPLHIRVYMYELIGIGLVGGFCSTYSALLDMVGPDTFTKPCYWPS